MPAGEARRQPTLIRIYARAHTLSNNNKIQYLHGLDLIIGIVEHN